MATATGNRGDGPFAVGRLGDSGHGSLLGGGDPGRAAPFVGLSSSGPTCRTAKRPHTTSRVCAQGVTK
jgi:hypothetical protein